MLIAHRLTQAIVLQLYAWLLETIVSEKLKKMLKQFHSALVLVNNMAGIPLISLARIAPNIPTKKLARIYIIVNTNKSLELNNMGVKEKLPATTTVIIKLALIKALSLVMILLM